MTAETPLISVILVTWNVRDLALQCLASLARQGIPLEILLVDNASKDGTTQAVRESFPDVIIIDNTENVGFPRANNQALVQARGRYVLFLNPDTLVGDGVLAGCAAELERDASIGMVGCRLIYPDGTTQYESARRTYLLRDLLTESLYLHMLLPNHPFWGYHLIGEWDHLDSRDVEAISGAFMMVRREIALALGGFPEKIFMYHEDLSLCLRVQRAGWRIRYLGNLVTTHFAQQSARRTNARLDLLEAVSQVELIKEAQGPVYAAVARAVFAIRSFVRLGVSAILFPIARVTGLDAKYPRALHVSRHFLQFVWSICPPLTHGVLPKPPASVRNSDLFRAVAPDAG